MTLDIARKSGLFTLLTGLLSLSFVCISDEPDRVGAKEWRVLRQGEKENGSPKRFELEPCHKLAL
jgi:hypothetical protein